MEVRHSIALLSKARYAAVITQIQNVIQKVMELGLEKDGAPETLYQMNFNIYAVTETIADVNRHQKEEFSAL